VSGVKLPHRLVHSVDAELAEPLLRNQPLEPLQVVVERSAAFEDEVPDASARLRCAKHVAP
jgi:hypothetical protein